MVTIKEVAKRAGVSYSTVSRALADSSLVDSRTKEKVLRAAEELHYVPNQMARALKGGKTKTIYLVVPTLMNPFFPKLITHFEMNLQKRGYAILLGVSNYDREEELRCFRNARIFSADGIAFVPSSDDCQHIKSMIDACGVPVALVDRSWDLGTTCVTTDDRHGAYQGVEYLIRHGHRRIACVVRDISTQHFRERYEGCLQALRDYNIPQEEACFINASSIQETYEATIRLLHKEKRPTAFFSVSDWLASGIYSATMQSGFSIPGDVSVVGFDNIDDSKYRIPPMTTWNHPIDRIAAVAVDMLVRQLEEGTDSWGSRIVIPGQMIERDSVSNLKNGGAQEARPLMNTVFK